MILELAISLSLSFSDSTWCPVVDHAHVKGFRTTPWRWEEKMWVRKRECKMKSCKNYKLKQKQCKR